MDTYLCIINLEAVLGVSGRTPPRPPKSDTFVQQTEGHFSTVLLPNVAMLLCLVCLATPFLRTVLPWKARNKVLRSHGFSTGLHNTRTSATKAPSSPLTKYGVLCRAFPKSDPRWRDKKLTRKLHVEMPSYGAPLRPFRSTLKPS